MSIDHALAVVPVTDFEVAHAWLSAIRDPEGNTITFIGDFRVQY